MHRGERRKETTRRVRELEAEAVAFIVSQAIGLDALEHSSDYIQLYSCDKDLFLASLGHIQKAESEIIAGLMTPGTRSVAVRRPNR